MKNRVPHRFAFLRTPLIVLVALTAARISQAEIEIRPTFADAVGESWTATRQAVVNQAIDDWISVLYGVMDGGGVTMPTIDIEFTFDNAGATYLAQASTSFSAFPGDDVRPWSSGVDHAITVNADRLAGSNFLWFDPSPNDSGDDKPFAAWDALTTTRHEIGHVLGFSGVYADDVFTATETNPWTELVINNVFDPGGLNVPMQPGDPTHLLEDSMDMMDVRLSNLDGRLPITETHVSMLTLAYEYLATPQTVCGDFDLDGDVDSADRTVQTTNWTGALVPGQGNAIFADGDCDGDGDIDTADQNGLIQNWTGAQQARHIIGGGFAELIYIDDPDLTLSEYSGAFGRGVAFDAVVLPEPSAFLIALIGVFLLFGRKGHR